MSLIDQSSLKKIGAVLIFALLSGCATFSGGEKNAAANVDAGEAAQAQIVALQTEIARVKSQNARLSNEVLALQRERDMAALDQSAAAKEAAEDLLPPKPEFYSDEQSAKPKAVVDDAAAPTLAKSDVPVETAPRLVQPTFASNETVFENEAEGDIKTESVLFGVHLASYRHPEEARTGWRQLQRENPDELGLLEPRLESVTISDKGEFLRLVGGGFASREKAEALCAQLKARGLFCSVTGFEGERLSLAD